jgi:ribosomal protein S4
MKNRQSEYGKALKAKQAVKAFYGSLTEGQFQHLYEESVRISFQHSNLSTLEHFLGCLESRVDVLLYRAGFATSVAHANQWVNHGKVSVNGRRVYSPGLALKSGDCLSVHSATSFQSGVFGLETVSAAKESKTAYSSTNSEEDGKQKQQKQQGKQEKQEKQESKGSYKDKAKKKGPGVVFGGHFVVSPKLASMIYLRPPKLETIPKYPFVGELSRRPKSGDKKGKKGEVVNIVKTNEELFSRMVTFCARG